MKKILLIVLGGFILLIVIGLIASPESSKKSLDKGFEQGKQAVEGNQDATSDNQNKVTYSLQANATVASDGKISVTGTSNLPNGSLLDVNAMRLITFKGDTEERESLEGMGIEKASVFNGSFNTVVSLNNDAFSAWSIASGDEVQSVSDNIHVKIIFDPKRQNPAQNDDVLTAVGSQGENLASSPQRSELGGKTNNPYNQLGLTLSVVYKR